MKIRESTEFLFNITKELLKEKDFNSLIQKVLGTVKKDFGLLHCALLLYDEIEDEIYVKSFIGFKKGDIKNLHTPVGKGITGKCAKQKKVIYVPDVSKDPEYLKKYPLTKSELAIPIVAEKKLLGVLNFEKKQKDSFTEQEKKILSAFSSIVSIALKNTLLFERISKKERQKDALVQIARTATGTMRKSNLFGKLVSLGGKLVDADKCAISLYDKDKKMVEAQLPGFGVKRKTLEKLKYSTETESCAAEVVRTGKIYVTNDAKNDKKILKNFVKMFNVKKIIVSPLKISNEVVGVFYVVRSKNKYPFTKDDKDIILIFSSLAANLIKKMQTFKELRKNKKKLESTTEELKRANEELKNISLAKTNLISNISHELKTPLVSIKGYTDILLEKKFGDFNEKQRLSLVAIKRNAERLINSINNLIDISMIELGATKSLERELVNIPTLMDETIELILPLAKKKNILVKKEFEEDSLIVEADREKLSRVFLNILDNAIKFNRQKGEIIVKCQKSKKNVITEIKDNGIGIPKKYKELIFRRFFQIDHSAKRVYRGSGIGLSLCLDIVRYFNGDIKVKSKPNKGSSFKVILPAK